MTKWKCDRAGAICFRPCYAECEGEDCAPDKCLFSEFRTPKWKRVPDEPEQKSEPTLPDWCKIGAWVWNKSAKEYVKITDISNGLITGKGVCDKIDYTDWHLSYYCEARLRPYNAEEMKALVGKVIEDKIGNRCLITVFTVGDKKIVAFNKYCSADDLWKTGYTIDGKPCEKLEHLENGEWVE